MSMDLALFGLAVTLVQALANITQAAYPLPQRARTAGAPRATRRGTGPQCGVDAWQVRPTGAANRSGVQATRTKTLDKVKPRPTSRGFTLILQ